MENIEKRIEEMKKDICHHNNNGICEIDDSICDRNCIGTIESELLAKKLINKGWVKLHKDSIVLSKDEYEKLKGERKLCDNCGTYFQSAWTACPKCGTKPSDYERGSKETAEKIYYFVGDYYDSEYLMFNLETFIKEQFGVEIKEN